MTKDIFFNLLISGLESDNVHSVFTLITQYNDLAKTLDVSQLVVIDNILRSSSNIQNPDLFRIFIETNLYKKAGGGAGAFVNELPFAVPLSEHVERYSTSAQAQNSVAGYPDCIDLNTITNTLQGWELKNLSSRQYLPELQFGNRYGIITDLNHFDYYRSQFPNCELRNRSVFPNPDVFIHQQNAMTRLSRVNSMYSFDRVNNILKVNHVFKFLK